MAPARFGDKDVAASGLLEIVMRRLRNAVVRRCQRFGRSVLFWLARPTLWELVLRVRVFRLLVWLDDPLANWWWRVSGLQAAYWRGIRTRIIGPGGPS